MKKILIILVLTIFIGSCQDSWLDENPSESISTEKAFSSEEALKATVVGLYYTMMQKESYGCYITMNSELRGDDMILTEVNNWNYFVSDYNYSYEPGSSYGNKIYLSLYETIEGCNSILDADKEEKINLTDDIKVKYLAEVKAIRAQCYFTLVRLFCNPYTKDDGDSAGLPLKIESDVDVLYGRGKVKDVYTQIIKDLIYAEKYIPELTNLSDQMNKTYVQGLLARVYMTMGNYTEAVKMAQEAQKTAPTLSQEDYTIGVTQDNPSIIFRIEYTDNTYLQYNSLQSAYDYGYLDAGGYGVMGAAPDFVAKYDAQDRRQSWFINSWCYTNVVPFGAPMTYTSFLSLLSNETYYKNFSGQLWPANLWDESTGTLKDGSIEKLKRRVWDPSAFHSQVSMFGKFPRKDATYAYGTDEMGNPGTPCLGDVTMMRSEELYLIEAECAAMAEDYSTARNALLKIQENANAQLFSGSDRELLAAIRLERRKELIGEGFRIFDIIRQGETVTRNNYWGNSEFRVLNPNNDDSKVILPIPQATIDSNPKMSNEDQNSAYK